jgi:Flp pilus assembly protein TadB
MNTIADDINSQISAGRRTIQRSLGEMPTSMDQVPRPVLVATGVAVFVAAVGIGWMLYRTRRRRTLVQRLQDALPNSVRDLPDGLRARAKGPIERVAKSL